MFYRDKSNIPICQMGTGDVLVSVVKFKEHSTKEVIGVAFSPKEKGEINKIHNEFEGKYDFEVDVKFKLYFTKPESIDVVIYELEQAKKLMLDVANEKDSE